MPLEGVIVERLQEHIFAQDRPFASCHASTLVALPGGRVLAAWFGGTQEGHPDVAIWGATRDAGWGPPRLLAKVRELPHWNPVLFAAPGGQVHLFFKVGENVPVWETWHAVSGDGGDTWSDPQPLVPEDVGGRGPVKNKPIVLSAGAWLAPASLECQPPHRRWDVFVDRSEDEGRTWQASPLVPLDHASFSGAGAIQPTLWESAPGQVHMLVRTTGGYVGRSDSADGGRTWSPLRLTDLPNNNSGLDLARLPGGTLVLCYNPVSGNWAERTPLSLAISRDNGESWPRWLNLETAPGEYSYPALIPSGSGVALTYTWRRERIAYWRLPVPGAG